MNELDTSRATGWRSLLCILLLFAIVAGLRIGAHSDLHEGDQSKQADYVLDIVCNGNWIVQHHADGSIMSKPPLYNWLAAPAVLLFSADEVWLKWPSLMAGLAAVLMCWDMARRRLGERAAFLGCVFLLLTSMFAKQMYYARTDMLLTCFIAMQFWAVIRWEDDAVKKASYRSGWIWIFWIAAALGNLAKGPIALLPHLALAAYWMLEGCFRERYRRMGLWWGLPLALLPLTIWFGLAWRIEGEVVYGHLVRGEMLDRFKSVAEKSVGDNSNRPVYYYLPQVIGRTLPWSLFALVGFWRAIVEIRHDNAASGTPAVRGMLCFLTAWFFAMLLFWSLIPSKRVDRIFPAVPAFCMLAGWAFDGFLKTLTGLAQPGTPPARLQNRVAGWSAVLVAVVFALAGAGSIALALGAHSGPFKVIQDKLSPATLQSLGAEKPLVLAATAVMAFGGLLAIGAFVKKRARVLAGALVAANMAVIVLYQLALAPWAQTDFCQGSERICREVRKRAKAEGAEVMVLAGSGPAARFYLLKAGLAIQPKDAEARLAKPHGAIYVAGTQAYLAAGQRKPGGLEQAGLGGLEPLPVPGVPSKEFGGVVPGVRWLGAVKVEARE